jgi:CheY-like chemotaxis protein
MNGTQPLVMLVDDDPELRQSMVDLLEDEGYRTVTAASGREALMLLRTHELPNLILLDLMMPDLNGWQFCEMQQRDPSLAGIPVLVVTAARTLAQTPAGVDVLLKPFSLEEVLEKVQRLTGRGPVPSSPASPA